MSMIERIFKVLTGEWTGQMRKDVLREVTQDAEAGKEYNRIKNTWALMASQKPMSDYRLEGMYVEFRRAKERKRPRLGAVAIMKYAAVIVLLLSLPSLVYLYQRAEGMIKAAGLSETTVCAENGQQSKVVLPDGSEVWLNAGTSITYNQLYGTKNRSIRLDGQAFFAAARNELLPMVVEARDLRVEVLGTRFDVEAYSDQDVIQVTLQSGSVQLSSLKDPDFQYRLKPGYAARYFEHSSKVRVEPVEVDRIIGWTEGVLYFEDSNMEQVLASLERHYNVEFEVQNQAVYESVFTATIHDEPLNEILRSIEYACSVRCKIIKSDEPGAKTKVVIY